MAIQVAYGDKCIVDSVNFILSSYSLNLKNIAILVHSKRFNVC